MYHIPVLLRLGRNESYHVHPPLRSDYTNPWDNTRSGTIVPELVPYKDRNRCSRA